MLLYVTYINAQGHHTIHNHSVTYEKKSECHDKGCHKTVKHLSHYVSGSKEEIESLVHECCFIDKACSKKECEEKCKVLVEFAKHFKNKSKSKLSLHELKLLKYGVCHKKGNQYLLEAHEEIFCKAIYVARKLGEGHPIDAAIQDVLFCPINVLQKDMNKVEHVYNIILDIAKKRNIAFKSNTDLRIFLYFIAQNEQYIDDAFTLPDIEKAIDETKGKRQSSDCIIEEILSCRDDVRPFEFTSTPPSSAFYPVESW